MKIDTATNPILSSQRTSSIVGTAGKFSDVADAVRASSSTSTSQGGGVRQLDFSSMTRQEMRDWVNDQVKSGAMSLDESAPFSSMTMKIPVASGREVAAAGDSERIDFTKKISEGIQGALSRNDKVTLQMLQSALATTQKYQGQAVGIDMHV